MSPNSVLKRFIAVTWLCLGPLSAGGSEMTRSQMLFSALETPTVLGELPDEIIIPEEWLKTFRAVGEKTAKTGVEYGGCLNLITATNIGERKALLDDYSQLLGRRKSTGSEAFADAEKELRARIEKAGDVEGNSTVWSVGKVNDGDKMSVNIEHEGVTCEGESVGEFHTHPPRSLEYPSDNDAYFFMRRDASRVSFVIGGDRVCGVVKTERSDMQDNDAVVPTYGLAVASTNLSYLRSGNKASAEKRSDLDRIGIATAFKALDVAMYCGKLGEPLRSVPTMRVDDKDPRFYILSKGLVTAIANVHKIEPLTFEFTPTLDQPFKDFLRLIPRLDELDLEYLLEDPISPGDFYNELLTAIRNAGYGYSISPTGIGYPDVRYGAKDSDSLHTSCLYFSDSKTASYCSIESGTWDMIDPRVHANYRPEKDSSFLVEKRKDGYYLRQHDPEERSRLEGNCVFVKSKCLLNGKGKATAEGKWSFEGNFRNGDMDGKGVYTNLATGERWNVKKSPKKNRFDFGKEIR